MFCRYTARATFSPESLQLKTKGFGRSHKAAAYVTFSFPVSPAVMFESERGNTNMYFPTARDNLSKCFGDGKAKLRGGRDEGMDAADGDEEGTDTALGRGRMDVMDAEEGWV